MQNGCVAPKAHSKHYVWPRYNKSDHICYKTSDIRIPIIS